MPLADEATQARSVCFKAAETVLLRLGQCGGGHSWLGLKVSWGLGWQGGATLAVAHWGLCVCAASSQHTFHRVCPGTFLQPALLNFFKKSFRCFFFFSIETNPHSACCWVFTSADCQPLRSAPTLAITPRVCLLVGGTTFIFIFGSFAPLLAAILVASSLTHLEVLLQGSVPPPHTISVLLLLLPYTDFTPITSSNLATLQRAAWRFLMAGQGLRAVKNVYSTRACSQSWGESDQARAEILFDLNLIY